MKYIKTFYKVNIIFFLILIIILFNSSVYAKGAYSSVHSSSHISGAKSSSSKTYTKSSTSKSSISKSSTINLKGFNSSGSTTTTLIPKYFPFLFLMYGNNYNINGKDKKLDFTLSNIIIKLLIYNN